jgi:hypothetical protein
MFKLNDQKFRKLIEHGIQLRELELRLQPELGLKGYEKEVSAHGGFGDYSREGFLGRNESLLEIVHADWGVVEKYGTTHQEIAKALADAIRKTRVPNKDYKIEHQVAMGGLQECPWECNGMYAKGNGMILIYHAKKTSQQDLMAIAYAVMMGGKAEKIQEGLGHGKAGKMLSKFLASIPQDIGDLTDRVAVVTELHPHLIGEHYFFEGRESPYRADPRVLIEALDLAKAPRT